MKRAKKAKTKSVYQQYDIWWANLPELPDSHVMYGMCPVLIASNNMVNTHNEVMTVVPLTTRIEKRQMPTHVLIYGVAGLRQTSRALCEQPMSLDKSELVEKIGSVTDWYQRISIQHALAVQLGLGA